MEEINRTFDRQIRFDERSKNFPAVTPTLASYPLRSYSWRCNTWLDQGREGACTAFAVCHELAAVPVVVPVNNNLAFKIYHRGQQIDIWPGEDYSGTSVLASVQASQEIVVNTKGKPAIQEYRWAFGLEDAIRVIGYRGGVVVGSWWYSGMFNTDSQGFLHRTGTKSGGHAYYVRGVKIVLLPGKVQRIMANVDLEKSYVCIHNSWGKDWGVYGRAKLSLQDFKELLLLNGEVCIPTIRNFM